MHRVIEFPKKWQAWLGLFVIIVLGVSVAEHTGIFAPVDKVIGAVVRPVVNFFRGLFGRAAAKKAA